MKVDIGAVDDFTEGRPRTIRAGGREFAVVRWRGDFFATSNRCPHMGAKMAGGVVSENIEADQVGVSHVDHEKIMIGCPWHGWQFDMRTGCSTWDPAYRILAYKVETDAGRVLVNLPQRRRAAGNPAGDTPETEQVADALDR